MTNIKIRGLSKSYGDKLVLEDFSTEIIRNKFNIIIGPSGSGKTTFLRILMGLEDFSSGEIKGLDKLSVSPIFQENRLLEKYSCYENIKFVNDSLSSFEIDNLMGSLGLYNLLDTKVYKLSGGMKRRLAILRGIVNDSDLYIFDEPFRDMDDNTYFMVLDFVKNKLQDKTVIFTTHRSEEIKYFKANTIKIKHKD